MEFTVLQVRSRPPATATRRAYLVTDNWDDWAKYSTMYTLIFVDATGQQVNVGSVKIGAFGMAGVRRPPIPDHFEQLADQFFSLGQDSSYYETLNQLDADLRDEILIALRDMARDPRLFEAAKDEHVTKISLLRSVSTVTLKQQFHRMALGGARLTKYDFAYRAPAGAGGDGDRVVLNFSVVPESHPPTNIHVLIGRNGVGKTRFLNLMTRSLVDEGATKAVTGEFIVDGHAPRDPLFSNLVSVSFSAFDSFLPLPERRDVSAGMRYSYVGLKRPLDAGKFAGRPKSPKTLGTEFVNSVRTCLSGARLKRWRRALETLEGDPIFRDAEVVELATRGSQSDDAFKRAVRKLFDKLSSGHKIVLLTITRMVEKVEEKTLVLLDEPEGHLHPPLLAAFVRALSDLLIDRNGVAIVATHSPVMLQEVPRECVWKLQRSGSAVRAERPEAETFGENVGVLTREVFGLELTHSGFHKMISDAVAQGLAYEDLVERFGAKLGAEARAIARALIGVRDNRHGTEHDARQRCPTAARPRRRRDSSQGRLLLGDARQFSSRR